MSITNELREFARRWPCTDYRHKDMLAIADRIDAEHERTKQDLIDANNQIEQLCECSIELPADADGEVWHVGDLAIGEINPSNPKKVERMLWYGPDSGWQLETNTIIFPCPERVRHYHAPTVEDVLREFGDAWVDGADEGFVADLIERFASRLQLREDA